MKPEPFQIPRLIRDVLPYVAGYGVALYLSFVLVSPIGSTAVWMPVGILASAFLLLDRRSGWVCAAVCLVLHISISVSVGNPLQRAAFLASLTFTEILAIVWLTRRTCGPNLDFSDARRLLRLMFGAVLPACGLGALAIELLWVGAKAGPADASPAILWGVSHTLGAAMVIPATVAIVQRRRYAAMRRPPLEFVAAMTLVLAVSVGLFLWRPEPVSLFLIFPMMMLTAFRYGPVGAATGSLVLALMCGAAVHSGLHSLAVDGADGLRAKLAWVQVFVAVVFLTTLPVSGAVASYARLRNLLTRRTLNAREARRRADDASAAKGEFLANMSHEIRTPLNGVIGLADALSRTDLKPPQKEMLKMILGSGQALNGLLGDALDLARADSGALKLAHDAFDVREALAAAARPYELRAREKGLGFELRFDLAPPGAAVGDALRIRQVASKLMSNAVKFTARGAVSVEVSLLPRDSARPALRVAVRDTGPGFGPEVQARLFRRFEQGDNSVTRRYGGSGLGLTIADRLAEMMGGRISCTSTVGRGSEFVFEVEVELAAAGMGGVARAVAASEAPEAARRRSVLLAEDHPVNRKVIQAMLGDTVELVAVDNGRAAVEACAQRRFDVILMDTHMPVMDGLAAIRALRAEEARTGAPRTPVISLTADAMPEQVRACVAAGADLHVAKPITSDALHAALGACAQIAGAARPKAAAAG